MLGLDNDGDLAYDESDSDCSATDALEDPGSNSQRVLSIAPNPVFEDQTRILYRLSTVADVQIRVYDVTGRIVRTRDYRELTPGLHTFWLDGRDRTGTPLSNGIYVVRVVSNGNAVTGRVVWIK
jgi:hypothetical protein